MPPESDNDLASLLRAAGVRVQGPEQMSPAVKAAVEAEWQATQAAQVRRRRIRILTISAVVLVLAAVAWFARPLYLVSHDPIAKPAGLKGAVEYKRDGGDGWLPLTDGIVLKPGDSVRTGDAARMRLALVNGVTLALDAQTRITMEELGRLQLRRGALYLDSGPVTKDDPRKLRVYTPAGLLKHYGAQYEARIVEDQVIVSLRSGHILVVFPHSEIGGDGGERLVIEDGNVTHQPLPTGDGTFAWLEN